MIRFGTPAAGQSLPIRALRAFKARAVPAAAAVWTSPVTAVRMALVIVALPVLERALSLPRMLRLLGSSGLGAQPARLAEAHPIVATSLRTLEPLLGLRLGRFRDNCMTRSLVLFHCLRRAAIPVSVHFGVERRGDGDLSGHCWLELDGRPLAEDPEPLRRLRPTYIYSAT